MLRFEPWKIALVCIISLLGILYAAPNFMAREAPGVEGADTSSGWLPGKQINLGLDLQGGVHLLIEVEVEAVVGQIMDNMVEEVRPRLRGRRFGVASRFCAMDVGYQASILRLGTAWPEYFTTERSDIPKYPS